MHGEWTPPLPEIAAYPPSSDRARRAAFEADIWLSQLPPFDYTVDRETYGPWLRLGRTKAWDLVAIQLGRRCHYGLRLPQSNTLRLVRVNRRVGTAPEVPGVPAVGRRPRIECCTLNRQPSRFVRIIARSARQEVAPSRFEPAAWRSAHSPALLPSNLRETQLRTDATGWWRSEITYTPPSTFETLHGSQHPDGVRFLRQVWNLQAVSSTVGLALTMDDLFAGLVDVHDEWIEPLSFDSREDLEAFLRADWRSTVAKGITPR